MSLCLKSAVLVLLVTELTFSVSQQYVCGNAPRVCTELRQSSLCCEYLREAAIQHALACGSFNTNCSRTGDTAVKYTSPMTMHSASFPLPCSTSTVTALQEPYPHCGLDSLCYWLCHGGGVASLLLLLLLLATDLATCYQHKCTVACLLQLLTASLLLVSNPRLQAMLLDTAAKLLSLDWGTFDSASRSIFPTIYPPLIVSVLLLRLQLLTATSASSPNLCDLDCQPAAFDDCLLQQLQQLTIGPSVISGQDSWLRRAQDLRLLSSPLQPAARSASAPTLCLQVSSSPPMVTASSCALQCSQPTVLWPGHLHQPTLSSATTSLSLTDQPSHFLDLL